MKDLLKLYIGGTCLKTPVDIREKLVESHKLAYASRKRNEQLHQDVHNIGV